MCKFKTFAGAAVLSMIATMGAAEGWTLNPDLSKVSFGSIKNDYIGEAHSFSDVSGSVSDDGAVEISLGLASVQTLIDIRNERMVEHVFQNAPAALITAQLDMDTLNGLAVGEAVTLDTVGTLDLLGTQIDLDAAFFVMRVADGQVLVTTDKMLLLSTEDAGINAGIDKLQELASLDSITRVSPVTMRLFFEAGA